MRLPSTVEPNAANGVPLSPLSLLDRSIIVYADKLAVAHGERRWTYREFGDLVRRMAGALEERGIGPGDTVSIVSANRPEMLAAHFAVPMLGAVLNTINTRLDVETIRYILDHCSAQAVIADKACVDQVAEACGDVPLYCLRPEDEEGPGEALDLLDGKGMVADWPFMERVKSEWQPIAINYTSGTTGSPKGVIYHHRGAYINALNNNLALGFDRTVTYLWTLPMFHCNGWCHTWAVTAAGGTHVCLEGVDPGEIVAALKDFGVTNMACAPVVLYMMLERLEKQADFRPERPVRVATGGAAPTSALIERMDALGFSLVHLYGLTESYGPATGMLPDPVIEQESAAVRAAFSARQGHGLPSGIRVEVKRSDGTPVTQDGIDMGEIMLAGPSIMGGYHADPVATSIAFEGGMFHTGDLAVVHPDGAMEIRDRAKDIIITGGENVSSLEVESVLHRHPRVLLAAVVAAPHPKWGETPWAFIQLNDAEGDAPSEEDIIAFCRDHLAGFKLPRRIIFRELPRTATGKVQKFALRQQAVEMQKEDA
ncbi:AMP-binding protein [Roseibium aggregatum]|uniref:3-methylmercaptopropionyl-CoA ligase n=1 Tax=Roseibium aggregatum TaxID=187304 RepID=A0A926S4C8_9HYPH|nr:AMP-binding protein [Roseibium aggregatum]MBD1544945.1 AMP-binding protein [Roseibium aggregatum]